jgi:hypothetical protein
MTKRPRKCRCKLETEELVCDCDSEAQCTSDYSDIDFTHDFSEDSEGIVEADEEWHERREGKATVHHFTGPDPWTDSFCCT